MSDKLSQVIEKPSTLTAIRRLQASLPEYTVMPSVGMQYDEQVKYVTWKFDPRKFKTIELLHFTDVQFGHIECHVKRVQEYIDWVLDKPNRFVLFGGDMIDATNVFSPGAPWENIAGPQSQVYRFVELFAPLRARILGFVGGNHERRGVKTFGDLGVLLATLLQVPYSSGQQLIDIHYGGHKPFKIHLWHGGGASRTKGAKAQLISRFMDTGDAQLYLVGHLHDCIILPSIRIIRVPGANNVHMQKIVGGMSSSFLRYFGTYAEVAGLTPNDVLMLRTILTPDGKFEVTIK